MLDIVSRSHTNPEGENQRKPLKWILVDALIIGLIALCAVMPFNVPTEFELWVMFKAFLGAFILQLAIDRGLKKAE